MSDNHDDSFISAQVRAFEELLERRGLLDAGELDRELDVFLSRSSTANGARVVARAWIDEAFRTRLLCDANASILEIGLSMVGGRSEQLLKVVANTAERHNVIVCTLCSCYPMNLLGPSPSWYKSEAYRSRVVREPRSVLEEFGLVLEASVEITVWDSSSEARYMVLPRRPPGTNELGEDELAGLVSRNGLIGVAAC